MFLNGSFFVTKDKRKDTTKRRKTRKTDKQGKKKKKKKDNVTYYLASLSNPRPSGLTTLKPNLCIPVNAGPTFATGYGTKSVT